MRISEILRAARRRATVHPRRAAGAALAVLMLAAPPAGAAASATPGAGSLLWKGRPYCGATLIDAARVLTAAHCLRRGGVGAALPLRRVAFQPQGGGPAIPIAHVVGHGGYAGGLGPSAETIAQDYAVLALSRPSAATPARIGAFAARASGAPLLMAPAAGAARADHCPVDQVAGRVTVLDCPIAPGRSGHGVFAQTPRGPRLVAVVSALLRREEGRTQTAAVTASAALSLPGRVAGGRGARFANAFAAASEPPPAPVPSRTLRLTEAERRAQGFVKAPLLRRGAPPPSAPRTGPQAD